VSRENLSQELELAGEFQSYQEVELHAKVTGYLKSISVDAGDRVRRGQHLATIEIPEFQDNLNETRASRRRSERDVMRAQAEVRRVQSVLDAAKLLYSRLNGVFQSNPDLIARQEVDAAAAKVQEATAQLENARAALAAAQEQVRVQEAAEARAKTIAGYTVITAPFSGLITRRDADPGALIQAGSGSSAMPIVQLSEIDRLRLILPVPESAVPRVSIGQVVQIRVPALDREFEGRIARISSRVETKTRTMETQVDIANPEQVLTPGMYAFVSLVLEQRTSVLTVPVQAVSRREDGAEVWIVTTQNRLEPRNVSIGLETPERVEILSGLQENELVVIGRRSQFKPGQSVTAVETPPDGAETEN
jgi:RND family efflux transporter MFP subunit